MKRGSNKKKILYENIVVVVIIIIFIIIIIIISSYSLESTDWIPNHWITFTKDRDRKIGSTQTAIK